MPDSKELAQPATQEAQKEVVNTYDSKQGAYQEQTPQVSTGASPVSQDNSFAATNSPSTKAPAAPAAKAPAAPAAKAPGY